MSNVIALPGAAAAPIINPRRRGRRKGVISLAKARRQQEAQQPAVESPYHPSVKIAPPERGRFHYPRSLLLQRYACCNSYGWMVPSLSAGVLVSEEFISPLAQLLGQLEKEGHDVTGAREEYAAFREAATFLDGLFVKVMAPKVNVGDQQDWDIDFDGYEHP